MNKPMHGTRFNRHRNIIILIILLSLPGCESRKITTEGPVTPISSNKLMLSGNQIRLANIALGAVSKKQLGETLMVNGVLTTNKELSQVISSRAEGRVEKLFVKETGLFISKGMPLYTLYSERLLTLQQEYLLAKDQLNAIAGQQRYRSLLESAEKKLLLYGLSSGQIGQLTRQSIKPSVTFLAPASGVVTQINVSEGQYTNEGAALMQIDNISKLWVEAELYPTETPYVKTGDHISVRINNDESQPIDAVVTFLSPELRSNSQIVVLRASIENSNGFYKAGQQAQVYLLHSSKEAIAVPIDAVIRNGKGAHVYVASGRNSFEPRTVKTGIEMVDQIEITEGIDENDTIAISGAYLLYSELVLKRGIDPMAMHHH